MNFDDMTIEHIWYLNKEMVTPFSSHACYHFFHYLLDMLSVLLKLHTGSWHLLKGFLANRIKHLQNIVIRHFQLAICMSLPLVLHLLLPV